MKRIEAYLLRDGRIYPDFDGARRAAEKRYGDALSKLVCGLLQTDGNRYTAAHEYIDAHTREFEQLQSLKADCELANPQQE